MSFIVSTGMVIGVTMLTTDCLLKMKYNAVDIKKMMIKQEQINSKYKVKHINFSGGKNLGNRKEVVSMMFLFIIYFTEHKKRAKGCLNELTKCLFRLLSLKSQKNYQNIRCR